METNSYASSIEGMCFDPINLIFETLGSFLCPHFLSSEIEPSTSDFKFEGKGDMHLFF